MLPEYLKIDHELWDFLKKIIDKKDVLLSGDYKNGTYLDGHIMDSIMNGRHAPGI